MQNLKFVAITTLAFAIFSFIFNSASAKDLLPAKAIKLGYCPHSLSEEAVNTITKNARHSGGMMTSEKDHKEKHHALKLQGFKNRVEVFGHPFAEHHIQYSHKGAMNKGKMSTPSKMPPPPKGGPSKHNLISDAIQPAWTQPRELLCPYTNNGAKPIYVRVLLDHADREKLGIPSVGHILSKDKFLHTSRQLGYMFPTKNLSIEMMDEPKAFPVHAWSEAQMELFIPYLTYINELLYDVPTLIAVSKDAFEAHKIKPKHKGYSAMGHIHHKGEKPLPVKAEFSIKKNKGYTIKEGTLESVEHKIYHPFLVDHYYFTLHGWEPHEKDPHVIHATFARYYPSNGLVNDQEYVRIAIKLSEAQRKRHDGTWEAFNTAFDMMKPEDDLDSGYGDYGDDFDEGGYDDGGDADGGYDDSGYDYGDADADGDDDDELERKFQRRKAKRHAKMKALAEEIAQLKKARADRNKR